jgi:hypothetical protein
MIRIEVLKQLTKLTYTLETDEEDGIGGSGQDLKQLTNLTYTLETGEMDGIK